MFYSLLEKPSFPYRAIVPWSQAVQLWGLGKQGSLWKKDDLSHPQASQPRLENICIEHTQMFFLLFLKWDRIIIACGSHITLYSVSVIFSLLGESTRGNNPRKERLMLAEFEIPEHHGTDGHGGKGMKQLVTLHHSQDTERWVLEFSTFSPFYSIWKHTYQVVQLSSRAALLSSVKPSRESPHEHTHLILSPVKPAMKISHRK